MKIVVLRACAIVFLATTTTAAMAQDIPLNITVSGSTGAETAPLQLGGTLISTTTSAASAASLASIIAVSTTSTMSTN